MLVQFTIKSQDKDFVRTMLNKTMNMYKAQGLMPVTLNFNTGVLAYDLKEDEAKKLREGEL